MDLAEPGHDLDPPVGRLDRCLGGKGIAKPALFRVPPVL